MITTTDFNSTEGWDVNSRREISQYFNCPKGEKILKNDKLFRYLLLHVAVLLQYLSLFRCT